MSILFSYHYHTSTNVLLLPGRAISFVTKNFFSKANGNRGGAPNVAVVMVDGWPTDKVEEVSRVARESGINVFFITVEGAAEREKQHVVEPSFASKVHNRPVLGSVQGSAPVQEPLSPEAFSWPQSCLGMSMNLVSK